jgi:hypothetical protein
MRFGLSMMLALTMGLATLTLSAAAVEEESDHAEHEHRFVRITRRSLHPKEQKIDTDEAFGWVNYSSRMARVSFDREVAKKMLCTTRGDFRITGKRLESGDLQGRQFAALCRLAPGAYAYRVELRSGSVGIAGAERTLEGTLIVE